MARKQTEADPVLLMARTLAEQAKGLCRTMEGKLQAPALRDGMRQVRKSIDALVDGYEVAIKGARK